MDLVNYRYSFLDFPMVIPVTLQVTDEIKETVDFTITSLEHFRQLNELASQFYSLKGFVHVPDMSFKDSEYYEEQDCFVMACIADIKIKRVLD